MRGDREARDLEAMGASSSERGATLIEIIATLSFVVIVFGGVMALYTTVARQQALVAAQDDLTKAVRDVQSAYAGVWFGSLSAAEILRIRDAIEDRNTPHGRIQAGRETTDAGDAFRMGLSAIPYGDASEFCAPLRRRILQLPYVDGARCFSSGGRSVLEFRVRGEEDLAKVALTTTLWATSTPTPTPTPTPPPGN